MSIEEKAEGQRIEVLDFTVATWKNLKKNGVSSTRDLLILTHMPGWGSRLLQCGKRNAWEIACRLAEGNSADLDELLRMSGYDFRDREILSFETADQHLIWIPMPRTGREIEQFVERGV